MPKLPQNKIAPFLSGSYVRRTYCARRIPFPLKTDLFNRKKGEGSEGASDAQGGLGFPSLNQRAPNPRPPRVMTSPHPIQSCSDQMNERVEAKAFWKKTKLEAKIEKELRDAGISIEEYLKLKNEKVGLTLRDMHIYVRNRRSIPAFWVRTPQGGLARISGEKIIYFPPSHSFNIKEFHEQDLIFLSPYLANFQHVHTSGSASLQKIFQKILKNINRLHELAITHQPSYQTGEDADLVNRLNAELTPTASKWHAIASRYSVEPNYSSGLENNKPVLAVSFSPVILKF